MGANASDAPRASVVMCARNEAPRIGVAIESILAQGHDDVEILVVDDRSTDGTADVAASYPGVRVIRNDDGEGLVGALNLSVEAARSDILVRLDADDWHLSGSLDALIGALETDPAAAVVAGGARYVDEDGRGVDRYVPMPTREHMMLVAMVMSPIEHTASAYRRSAVLARGGYRAEDGVPVAEDNDLWLRFLDAGERVVGLTTEVAVHRIRPTSVTNEFGAAGDARARRARAEFRARHAPALCRFETLRRLGRDVVGWDDPTGRSAMFSYALVRLSHLAMIDREVRRSLTVLAAALSLGPHRVVRGVARTARGRAAQRRARGRPVRSHLVSFVLGR